MAYFPFFIELEGREGLIVGGGPVALRKVQKLLPYGPKLAVAARDILPEISAISGLTLLRQSFSPGLLAGRDFIIAATDNRALNREIADLCRERHIPVNAVDDREACTFLFPALVKRGDLSIGISTGGSSPTAAVYLKEQISTLLPENFGPLLAWLDARRKIVKAALPDEHRRSACFARLFSACLEAGGPREEGAFRDILLRFSEDGGETL